MTELDTKAELVKLEEHMRGLALAMQTCDQERQRLANEIMKCMGAGELMRSIAARENGHGG